MRFRRRFEAALRIAREKVDSKTQRAVDAIGALHVGKTDNVKIGYKVKRGSDDGRPVSGREMITTTTPAGSDIKIDLIFDDVVKGDIDSLVVGVVHEGSHAADYQAWFNAGQPAGGDTDLTDYVTEQRAYIAGSHMAQSLNMDVYHKNFPGMFTWERKWQKTLSPLSLEVERANAVDKFIKAKYNRSEKDQGATFSQTFGGN